MRILFLLLSIMLTFKSHAQLQSPAQFLGYTIGERVTSHAKITAYFTYLAQASPTKLKLENYGTSLEGRPLFVVYISSEKHIANLAEIQKNNLRIAQGEDGHLADAPAILWMSYNVHGNETSSAEAAMLTAYDLLNPGNPKSAELLANTVVVIDPCLNPDGTDRYANWYNGIVGAQFNPLRFAREHDEPWPGGRYNHYYFDLNRDWAWQTQVESQQRVAHYNKWLPHVHVDFHEQGINDPYYFPPAAEPLHEVITPWQRLFQAEIGKFNAQYFDKQGWLYFTGERFDLFYPSYGDTYPIYSGAIGMTFEQAGNGSAGLGVITENRDTLTLVDRVMHHHASGMNVVEIVSQQQAKVVAEFKQYFKDAHAGKLSSFAAYVLKYSEADQSKIKALQQLLDRNQILYYAGKGQVKGLHYGSQQESAYSLKAKDMVIPGNQAKAALIRVLFEPEAKLADSVTYDITAWALPYVYGLDGVASKAAVAGLTKYAVDTVKNKVQSSFAYAYKWNGFAAAQLTAALLKKQVNIKYAEEAFTIAGEEFPAGSITIMHKGLPAKLGNEGLQTLADQYQVPLYAITSGIVEKGNDLGSPKVHQVNPPRVVLFAGVGTRAINVGEIWHYFDQQLGYPISLVNLSDFAQVAWDKVDILLLTNGSYPFLKDKTVTDQLANWVKAGGKIVALQGAVDQLSALDWSNLKILKTDSTKGSSENRLLKYADRERAAIRDYTGGAIFKTTFDETHPLMFGLTTYYTLKQDDKLYTYFEEGKGWNVGYLGEKARVSGFVGDQLSKKLKNGLVFGVQDLGKGQLIFLRDNVLFRNFWENGKLLMANALFFKE